MPPCRGEGPSPFGGAVSLLLSPAGESRSHHVCVTGSPITTTDELWSSVESMRNDLRNAGSHAEAERLSDAMTVSGSPGEVWPSTLTVLRALLDRPPAGLDTDTASACVAYLGRWP
jgi:hypothetical protein